MKVTNQEILGLTRTGGFQFFGKLKAETMDGAEKYFDFLEAVKEAGTRYDETAKKLEAQEELEKLLQKEIELPDTPFTREACAKAEGDFTATLISGIRPFLKKEDKKVKEEKKTA